MPQFFSGSCKDRRGLTAFPIAYRGLGAPLFADRVPAEWGVDSLEGGGGGWLLEPETTSEGGRLQLSSQIAGTGRFANHHHIDITQPQHRHLASRPPTFSSCLHLSVAAIMHSVCFYFPNTNASSWYTCPGSHKDAHTPGSISSAAASLHRTILGSEALLGHPGQSAPPSRPSSSICLSSCARLSFPLSFIFVPTGDLPPHPSSRRGNVSV